MFDQRGVNGLLGRSFSGYKITEFISRGGMGLVYKAHQESLNRPVAVKILYPHLSADESFRERFAREARAAAALSHPNIVRVIDFGSHDEFEYMIMDYIDGESLRDLLVRLHEQGETLPVDRSIRILNEVGAALNYAHDRGFVHRDVKPGNVLLTSDGRALLSDFGVVKAIGLSQMTHAGAVIGTPDYAAPEQSMDAAAIGPAADQYSLGIVAYEMLTGRVPFQGQTPTASWQLHMNTPPPPPTGFAPWIPQAAEAALMQSLEKQPENRHPGVMAFIDRLTAGLAESATLPGAMPAYSPAQPLTGQPPTVPPPPPDAVTSGGASRSGGGKLLGMLAAGALVLLLVCGVGGYFAWGAISGDDDSPTATVAQVAEEPTSTPESTATAEPEDDPTATEEPATSTPEPSPTEVAGEPEATATIPPAPQVPTIAAPIFRPTATPAPAPVNPTATLTESEAEETADTGEQLVFSDLTDWVAGEIEFGSGFPSDEGYHIRNNASDGREIWTGVQGLDAADLIAEIHLRLVSGGSASYACLAIRTNEDVWTHGFTLCINGDGYSFADYLHVSEESSRLFESLLAYEQRPVLNPANEWNALTIGAVENQFLFWINGEIVGAAEFDGTPSGTIGFMVYGFHEEPTEWVFTNLEAWSVE